MSKSNIQRRCHGAFRPIVGLICLFLAGCGGTGFELAPVHGTILIDGEPMPEGKVMFAPVARGKHRNVGKPALALVQSDGSYRLTTYHPRDGAIVGDHWVTIINSEESEELPEFARFLVRKPQQVLAGQDNRIDLKLTTDEIERYAQDDN